MQTTVRSDLLAEVLEQERGVWQALVDGDVAADEAALHADFLGVYPSGFATRAEHCEQLQGGPTVVSFRLSQARVLELGPDHVCLCYLAEYHRPGVERQDAMYVSSIWQRKPGEPGEPGGQGQAWVNIFSQDTPTEGSVPV